MIRVNPFATDPGGRLLIEPQVFNIVDRFRQLGPSAPESGGILLGFRRGEHLHIVEATVPGKADRRSRYGFHRQAASHQATAMRRWRQTDELMAYMGEWHTHPEDHPSPSGTDLRNWLDITVPRKEPMVFLILGRRTDWVGVSLGVEVREPDVVDDSEAF